MSWPRNAQRNTIFGSAIPTILLNSKSAPKKPKRGHNISQTTLSQMKKATETIISSVTSNSSCSTNLGVKHLEVTPRKSQHFKISIRRASKSFNQIPISAMKLVETLKSKNFAPKYDPIKSSVKSTLSKFFSSNSRGKLSKNNSSNKNSGSLSVSGNLKSLNSLNVANSKDYTLYSRHVPRFETKASEVW